MKVGTSQESVAKLFELLMLPEIKIIKKAILSKDAFEGFLF